MKPSEGLERKVNLPTLHTRAEFQAETANDEQRTVEVIWTTGAKVRRHPWFDEPYDEVLSLDPAHLRMDFINSGAAPLLNSHAQRSLEDVIGVVEKAWLTETEGRAIVRFSERDSVKDIWNDVRSGILKGISVGYRVYKFEREPMNDGDTAPTYRAVDWEPKEISLVAIGADDKATIRSDESQGAECVFINNVSCERGEEVQTMDENQTETPVVETPAAPNVDEVRSAAAAEATAAERKRVADIQKAVRDAKLGADFAEKLIADGVEVNKARELIINEWAKMDTNTEIRSQANVQIGRDETETRRQAVENAILVRAGIESAPSELGRRFVGLSMIEMARKLTGMEFGNKSEVATRAMSTSDFPLILGNVAEKMLIASYKKLGKTFMPFVTPGTLVDYKPAYRYQVGDAPALEEIKEGGEYKYGAFGEKAESVQLKDHGRMIKFTRQMLINDDLQAFQTVINNFGSAAARLESKLVYAILNDNPTMGDGVALFHADHANLASASAIDVTGLAAAEKLLMEQTTLDGEDYLNLVARFLVCGTAKKVEAQKILAAQVLPGKAADVNPFQGALQLIVDPRISGNKWFLAASPADIASIELAYLEGESGPVIDSKEGWNSDGLEVKCRHTVSVKALEHKGLVYNPGA